MAIFKKNLDFSLGFSRGPENCKSYFPQSPRHSTLGHAQCGFRQKSNKNQGSICWFLHQVEKIAFEILLSRQGHLHDEWLQRLENATTRRATTCRVRGYS